MTHPSTPPTVASGGKGRNTGKIVLFGCIGLVVAGVVLAGIGGLGWFFLRDGGEEAGTVLYRNSDQTFSGVRAENFLDFSFRYPEHWVVSEDAGSDSPNFIKIQHNTDDDFTIENFAVGYINGDVQQPALMESLLEQARGVVAAGFPGSRSLGAMDVELDERDGRGFTFEGSLQTDERGDFPYYGKLLLIPVTANRGVAVIAIASGLAEGVDGPDDVGEEGEIAGIIESFRFESTPASAAPATTGGAASDGIAGGGQEVHAGTLQPGDTVRDDGSLYDSYTFLASGGGNVVVTLRSADFDAYLTVTSPSQERFDDDDSGGGTDSRVEIMAAEAGLWTVMANAYRAGESGDYTLTIQQ
ncbi:MAG TPA: pre-peptidase C-terminal domain-containing protein [Gemmatimonadota bacterium]|nr:pre-peptidase C-terminal domain-containing protein [Gemmatimonadota bacterium]